MAKKRHIITTLTIFLVFLIGYEVLVLIYQNSNKHNLEIQREKKTLIRQEYKLIKLNSKAEFLQVPNIRINGSCLRNKCNHSQGVEWTMFFFIKSQNKNQELRQVIRETWGSLWQVEVGRFASVFITGSTNDSNLQRKVSNEARKYGDILQINQPDDYSHVVMKTLAGMEWASGILPDSYLYSSVDDDFMLDLLRIERVISHRMKSPFLKKWPEFPIVCMYGVLKDKRRFPIRDTDSKNYISKGSYPWTSWPLFCLGGFYVTSVSVARQLWQSSRVSRPLPADDVWITGILRNQIGMPDEMVLRVSQQITSVHCEGSAELMRENWTSFSKKLKESEVCTCSIQ